MKYELSMFLSPKMTDEDAEKKVAELTKVVEKYDGKVLESNFLGMKDLAYSIKHFNQGYYFIAKIESEPEKIKKIKDRVADELEAIRLMVTRQEKDVKLVAEEIKKEEGEKTEGAKEEVKEEKAEVRVEKTEKKPVEEKKEEKVEEKKEDKKEEKKTEKKQEKKETDINKKLDEILEEEVVD